MQWLLDRFATAPETPAFIHEDRVVSYGQVLRMVETRPLAPNDPAELHIFTDISYQVQSLEWGELPLDLATVVGAVAGLATLALTVRSVVAPTLYSVLVCVALMCCTVKWRFVEEQTVPLVPEESPRGRQYGM